MAVEVFFVPFNGVATFTPAKLREALIRASLQPKMTEGDSLLWLEFDGFKSRLLTSSGDGVLDLITLQYYGDFAHEVTLTDQLEELMESNGYCDAEELSEDADA